MTMILRLQSPRCTRSSPMVAATTTK